MSIRQICDSSKLFESSWSGYFSAAGLQAVKLAPAGTSKGPVSISRLLGLHRVCTFAIANITERVNGYLMLLLRSRLSSAASLTYATTWLPRKPTLSSITATVKYGPPEARGRSARHAQVRQYTDKAASPNGHSLNHDILDQYKRTLSFHPATCSFAKLATSSLTWTDKQVVLHGYLGTRRIANKKLTFAILHDQSLSYNVQLVSSPTKGFDGSDLPHQVLEDLPEHSPVVIEGTIKAREQLKPVNADSGQSSEPASAGNITNVELKVEKVTPLNTLPDNLFISPDTVFGPEQRHLQIRQSKPLRDALKFRGKVARFIRDHLADTHGFEELETPLLFKSTPEGAREFLVPTRTRGLAYALPQSPQQYKQILMASGIPRYMQIARCFRDEDLRADRQPEFTQVDLEMAFATGEDVMNVVEDATRALWTQLLKTGDLPDSFPRMSYHAAMTTYGSDKPDLRLGSEFIRVEKIVPADLIRKIGPLTDPAVDLMKVAISQSPRETKKFVEDFMDSPEARPFLNNPDGQPGIFIFDSSKPLQGLQIFGFEAAESLEQQLELQDGDLVVLQARRDVPPTGGSTPMGNLRLAVHKAAVKQGYMKPPEGFSFLWITDFPLFSPSSSDSAEPGQGGSTGLSSTHHPFTAPKTAEDVDLLLTNPLEAKADHYDLVVNGVELGGGSRRIHDARMQELVMRQVLGMSDERVRGFEHLLKVLKSGCPPHAGFALGFDRLIAVMLGKESVRDVIAFPKNGRGEDMLVKSPTRMTEEQLATYHLKLRD